MLCFFFKQKTAYEMRISDWSSDVCSSDLLAEACSGSGLGTESGNVVRCGLIARRVAFGLFLDQDVEQERGNNRAYDRNQNHRGIACGIEDHDPRRDVGGGADEASANAEKQPPRDRLAPAGGRQSTHLNSSHQCATRLPSSACKHTTTTQAIQH